MRPRTGAPSSSAFSRGHQHDRRAGVVHARRVAGGDGAVRLEHRLQLRQRLHRGVRAHVLVPGELGRPLLRLDLDRHDLARRRCPPPAARAARRCDSTENSSCSSRLMSCDSARFSAVTPMWMSLKGSVSPPTTGSTIAVSPMRRAPARVRHPVGAAAHRLGPAGDRDVGFARRDRLGGRHDRLHAGAAQPVDREGGHLLGDARLDRDHARHVHVLGRRVDHVAEHDLIDLVGLDRRSARAPSRPRARRDRWSAGPSGFLRTARRRCARPM